MAKTIKIIGWIVSSVLVLFLVGLGLIYLLPGYDLLLVRSESMVPAIKMGDLIITVPVNGDIKPGTIVTYRRPIGPITHRMLAVDGETLVTKGDAVEDPDPWSVTLSDVLGVYLFKLPYVGYLTNFVQTKLGWFLVIIIPAALLVAWLVKDILKEAFRNEPKTQ